MIRSNNDLKLKRFVQVNHIEQFVHMVKFYSFTKTFMVSTFHLIVLNIFINAIILLSKNNVNLGMILAQSLY